MTMRYKIFGWLLVGAILVFGVGAKAQSFDALKWDNRVLVLSAGESSPLALEQVALLRRVVDEIEARELVVLRLNESVLRKVDGLSPFPFQTRILDNRQEERYLQSVFSRDVFGEGDLVVTLVGFDGAVKERWQGIVEPSEIFDAIDAMVMRKRELNVQ